MNNAFIDEYDREAVNKKTMISLLDEGIEQDTQQGKKEEKIEIAKKMLKDNLDINIVATYTGLTKEELDKLF